MAEKYTDKQCILAIDQGTSGTKTLVINQLGKVLAKGLVALQSHYLEGGKVEKDPEAIFQNVLQAVNSCLQVYQAGGYSLGNILTCGISNQRETFLIWDQAGHPISNAIVWQCKRSIGICKKLKSKGLEPLIREKTGLIIDPYFSGTKLIWLYENDPKIKKAINEGKAYFGTVDSWLLFRLSKREKYLTDFTNASRTLFFNL
ncbi:MAG: FGGY family carbohydrate kinase, partial [Cyclobacteriaceae bacterium]